MEPDLARAGVPLPHDRQRRLDSWYAQGFSDGLGDRLLMFDNTEAPSWELLRLRPEFAAVPAFETAVRQRLKQLGRFQHVSFPVVRAVEESGSAGGLGLVSTYVAGRRLSDALDRPRSAATAVRLIRELAPALAALQEHREGVAHGALMVDRIMLRTDGHFSIREHVFGSALATLELSATQLWVELGIVIPPHLPHGPRLDGRADVIQLALVALSLMLGRRIVVDDYSRADDLLDRLALTAGRRSPLQFRALRLWLERALQLNGTGFASAREACDGLDYIPEEPVSAEDGFELPPRRTPRLVDPAPPAEHRRLPAKGRSTEPESADASDLCLETFPIESPAAALRSPGPQSLRNDRPAQRPAAPGWGEQIRFMPRTIDRTQAFKWIAAAICALAAAEAIVIAGLLYGAPQPALTSDTVVLIDSPQAGARVLVDDRPVGVTPLQLKVNPQTRSIRVTDSETAVVTPAPAAVQDRVAAAAASRPTVNPGPRERVQPSGVILSSAIDLDVFEDGRRLGSTAQGFIVTTAGRHQLDLVNSALGYRSSRVVNVNDRQVVSLVVDPGNGSININAVPWAQVWIDGRWLGETPLGKISVPLGEHEILFRHPELGERREKAIVRSDSITRVSANLQP